MGMLLDAFTGLLGILVGIFSLLLPWILVAAVAWVVVSALSREPVEH